MFDGVLQKRQVWHNNSTECLKREEDLVDLAEEAKEQMTPRPSNPTEWWRMRDVTGDPRAMILLSPSSIKDNKKSMRPH